MGRQGSSIRKLTTDFENAQGGDDVKCFVRNIDMTRSVEVEVTNLFDDVMDVDDSSSDDEKCDELPTALQSKKTPMKRPRSPSNEKTQSEVGTSDKETTLIFVKLSV